MGVEWAPSVGLLDYNRSQSTIFTVHAVYTYNIITLMRCEAVYNQIGSQVCYKNYSNMTRLTPQI